MGATEDKLATHILNGCGGMASGPQGSPKGAKLLALLCWSDQLLVPVGMLGCSECMKLACLLKGGGLVALLVRNPREENASPDIGQCSNSDRVAFSFLP